MKKHVIAEYQAVALAALVSLGSMVSFAASGQLMGHNMWLAFIASLGGGALLFLLYRGLLKQYPGQDLVGMCQQSLGRASKGVRFFFLVQFIYAYAYCLLALIFFWTSLTMPDTPFLVYAGIVIVLSMVVSSFGLEAIARVSVILMAILIIVMIIDTILAIPDMDPFRFLPFGPINLRYFLTSSGQFFSVQFGMTPLIFLFFDRVKDTRKAPRLLVLGWLVAIIYYGVNIIRSVAVLGDTLAVQYYPTGQILRMLEWNGSLSHLELGGFLTIIGVGALFLVFNQYAIRRIWHSFSEKISPALAVGLVEFILAAVLYRLCYSPHDKFLFPIGAMFLVVNTILLLIILGRGKKLKSKKRIKE